MLTSLALILLLGLVFGGLFNKIKLPGLFGMILVGIAIGPHALNLLDDSILNISGDLRQIALVIILTRAGLSLDLSALKKVGRPAVLMCFVPACFELLGCIVLGPALLGITRLEAAIMGSVLAAVSPAVIVPRMINLIEQGYGNKHSIPQILLAGSSVDDVFVIVIFTALTSLATTGKMNALSFLQIPVSIVLGIIMGVVVGFILVFVFKKFHMRDSIKLIIILSISFLLLELQEQLKGTVEFSALLAIMGLGIVINQKYEELSERLSSRYNKLWEAAQIVLFVLVGACVDVKYAAKAGLAAIVLVFGALVFRMVGVFVSLIKTKLTKKEKLFCMIAYTPKATVQAAIGVIPLTMGLECGEIVLTVAVLAILITAPLGAICVDNTYKKLLDKSL